MCFVSASVGFDVLAVRLPFSLGELLLSILPRPVEDCLMGVGVDGGSEDWEASPAAGFCSVLGEDQETLT